jgi:hypothetical protein
MRAIRASRLRVLLATAAVVGSTASFVVVPGHVAADGPAAAGITPATSATSRAPALLAHLDVSRTRFEAGRPSRGRAITLALGAISAGALWLVFGCSVRFREARARFRQLADAVFAPRRGPPHLAVTY